MMSARRLTLSALAGTPPAYWLGWIDYRRGRWASAERKFAAAVRAKPGHAASHFQRGMVEFKRERWEIAYSHMREALALAPDRTDWMVQFCQAARHLKGTQSKALEICTGSLLQRISADRANFRLRDELAAIYRIQGRAWLELEALSEAAALRPDDAALQFRLGEVCEKMERWPESAGFYRSAARLAPRDADSSYKAGFALEMTADPAGEAPRFYEMAIASDATGEASRFGIGAFHENCGRWKHAEQAYAERLAIRPQDAGLHFKVGMCRDRRHDWEAAARHYRDALALDASQPDWHRRLGFVMEKLGHFAAAAECYARLLQIPDKAGHETTLYRRAWSLDEAGRHEDACAAYAAALPDRGKSASADIAQITAKLAKDATRPAPWAALGDARATAGDWESAAAAAAFRQAADRSGDHEPAYYHQLGHALAKSGRYAEACAAYRNIRVLQRNPGASEEHFRRNAKFARTASYTEYSEVLPLRGKSVLYESFHGRMLSGNPYALFLHMLASPEFAGWTHIWAVEDMKSIPVRFKGMADVIFVNRQSDAFLRHLATASLLVSNVSFPSFFIRRDGQLYLNTWHGTPWKTLGRDAKSEFMTHGNVARNLLQATHIASPNRHTSDVLMEAYDLGGIFHGSITETGSPRVDLTLNASDVEKADLRKRLNIPEGRKVVLYAPTWRGTLESPRHEIAATEKVIETLAAEDCHLLFRGHYYVESVVAKNVVPADISTNELLAIVDVLVTDYSSVFFDFLPTGRPVIFYLEDHANYVSDRGLYFGLEELPGPIATNSRELAAALHQDEISAQYQICREKYCKFEDGDACRRTLEFVFSKKAFPAPCESKRTILIFGGHFSLNGITIALINLLRNVDYTANRVVLIVEMGGISLVPESVDYLKSLPAEVKVLPRSGAANTTLEERRTLGEFNKRYELIDGSPAFEILQNHFRREERRMFGSARFDAGIDFSGYSSFFACLFGFASPETVAYKSIYQHNEMYGEWKVKYPELERVFHMYRQFDHLISVSASARDLNRQQLAAEFRIPESGFEYVENQIDTAEVLRRAEEEMEPGDEEKFFQQGTIVFLTIGRLSVEKDHKKLIQAFAIIHMERPETRLLIIGDGPLAVMLDILVEELGLHDKVLLAGYRLNPFPYLKRADCFVFSSNHEGQGLVLLEAMMLRKPIVCADIEVCRGVVEGRSGLLVENSVDGLAGGMRDFLTGGVKVHDVDFQDYRRNAMEMFYAKSCGFIPAGRPG